MRIDRPSGAIECENVIGCEVTRREPYAGADMTPASLNVRPVEDIHPHEAPDPIRYGDTPSRPARMQIAVFQAVADWLSVSEQRFITDLWAPVHVASTNYRFGVHSEAVGPWGERANIERGEAKPYGSNFEVGSDNEKLLLMGRG